eukprot:TRINITY_DN2364_c0_g1_i1.p1 TRINITY_DN2364_c0_g1~~TRINITY_DN2364_c0_g1_i1.p1  ORF type:complete len:396 (-),score=71.63 TRINITY_DN2364_c0_g1_i1:803-1876(-)
MNWKKILFQLFLWIKLVNGLMDCSHQDETLLISTLYQKMIFFHSSIDLSLKTPNVSQSQPTSILFHEIAEVDYSGNTMWSFNLFDMLNVSRDCSLMMENGKQIGEQVSFQGSIPRIIKGKIEYIQMQWIYSLYFNPLSLSIWDNQNINLPSQNVVAKVIVSNYYSQYDIGRLQFNLIAKTKVGVLDFGEFVNPKNQFTRGLRAGYTNIYLPDSTQLCSNGSCSTQQTATGYNLVDSNPPSARIWIVPVRGVSLEKKTLTYTWAVDFWDPPIPKTNYNVIILVVCLSLGLIVILSIILYLFYRHQKLTNEQRMIEQNRKDWLESQLSEEDKSNYQLRLEKERLDEEKAFNDMKLRLKL